MKLGDVIRVKHGFAFKGEYFVDGPTPYVLVTPGNFAIGGGFQEAKPKFYRGPVPEEYVLRPGDLVVTMTDLSRAADTLGYSAVIPKDDRRMYLHNQRIGLVEVTQPTRIAKRWLHYLLRTSEYRSWVIGSASGSTVKHTSPSRIYDYEFDLPAIHEQQEMAYTLDTLEARIQLLRQTNTTLESLAQALFKSWFIDFDPVRAKAEGREPEGIDADTAALFPDGFEESELRLIPRGWSASTIGDVAANPRVQVRPEQLAQDALYIGLEHMPRRSLSLAEASTAIGLESGKFAFRRDDVLFGKLRPYFHKVCLAPCSGVCSTDILVIRPKDPVYLGFVALHAFSDALISYTTQLSNGAKMPRTSWPDVADYKVTVPPSRVAAAFSELVRPIFDRLYASIETAKNLAALRDALLPRLMSGKLRMEEAQEVPEGAT